MSHIAQTHTDQIEAMTPDEITFFKAMGQRIADLRKTRGMTQAQLADRLDLSQQMIASYEVGRRRIPVSLLPTMARSLAVPMDELIDETASKSKRGPAPKLLQQLERIQSLPRAQQHFVMQMIDTVLQQAGQDPVNSSS